MAVSDGERLGILKWLDTLGRVKPCLRPSGNGGLMMGISCSAFGSEGANCSAAVLSSRDLIYETLLF